MKEKTKNTKLSAKSDIDTKKDNPPGYPLYPPSEDIYSKSHKENDIDPNDITKIKESKVDIKAGIMNEKDFSNDLSGSDLDVPGSDLDDNEEAVGSEDEENNYYSLGGDDHNDLDENRGE